MLRKTILSSVVSIPLLVAAATAEEALVTQQGADELRGDWVIGAKVRSTQGETIGDIEDLILSQEDGAVTAAVVSVGGFLGIGSKSIAIDWNQLQIDWDANSVEVALTREEAEAAPEYAFRNREYEPVEMPATDTGTGLGTGTTETGTGTIGN